MQVVLTCQELEGCKKLSWNPVEWFSDAVDLKFFLRKATDGDDESTESETEELEQEQPTEEDR